MFGEPRATTRRAFLHRGLGLIGFGFTVPEFLARTVSAMTLERDGARTASIPGIPDDRVLVVVHFAGGNDGLNTVVPYGNDDYRRARPKLALPANSVLKIDEQLAFHPEATGLKQLWDDGRLCVVHGVGYPNPNRSHFVSTRIWHTASPDGKQVDGWVGRYFDNCCAGADPPPSMNAIALDEESPLALRGARFQPVCVANPGNFGADRRGGRRLERIEERNEAPDADGRKEGATVSFLRRSALDAAVSAESIRSAAGREIPGAEFPGGEFARQLQSVARMIAAKLPTRVYYVSLGGFDTHAGQLGRHARVLREGSAALAAFVNALRISGDSERTLVMTFSEFGRRVAENASGGTDHGQAAPVFLLGDAVRPGFVGTMPRLDQLSLGDQVFGVDFRDIYATVLKEWFRSRTERILPGTWKRLPLLKH